MVDYQSKENADGSWYLSSEIAPTGKTCEFKLTFGKISGMVWYYFGVSNDTTKTLYSTSVKSAYFYLKDLGTLDFSCHTHDGYDTSDLTPTGVSISMGVEYTFKIELALNSAKFYIDGSLLGELTTYVPADAGGNCGLKVSKSLGDCHTSIAQMGVPAVPAASFDTSQEEVDNTLVATFTDTSTNSPTSWLWDFDDGTTSTEQNPEHIFDTAGTYHVTLTATNSWGSNVSETTTITINFYTGAGFSYVVDTEDTLSVEFTDTSIDSPNDWSWNFGDGSTSTSQNPTHEYTTPGVYKVVLSVKSSSYFGTDTDTQYVRVQLRPASIQVTGDSDPLNFTYAGVGKQITDACWKCEVDIPTEYVPPTTDDLPVITVTVPDHTNTDQTIFYGIITNINYTQTPTGTTTHLTCYDYAYYLVAQYVPMMSTMYNASGSVYEPSLVINKILTDSTSGSSNWDHVTKIYPYDINVVSGWGSSTSGSCAERFWTWTPSTKKWSAIKDITDYTEYIFYVYWKYNDPLTNSWCPVAYFIDANAIDTLLDLPSKVSCTASTDDYMIGQVTTTNQDEYKYNRVLVYGGISASTGLTLTATAETSGVTNETTLPIEYVLEDDTIETQTLVDDVADAYLDYLNTPGDVYTAQFAKRMDLRLCQLLDFSGYDQIPDSTDMRITGINYSILPGDYKASVTFTTDRKFSALRKLKKVIKPNIWTEFDSAMSQRIAEIERGKLVDVISVSGSTILCKDSYGNYFEAVGPS